ncbi:trichohyalin-like [Paramacrobiotus metropolitanus]|uniref:trichohyalin-like n=1 Tax=Paramacrobiotus metropolitanus TaxID=2943436 RepID=UPI00244563E0|nr:trichohyalin-like [Paramacrobiotus metropolitanus]
MGGKKRSEEEIAAERAQKSAAKQAALDMQARIDIELLRLTKQMNPFQYTVNKRVPTWIAIAKEMNKKIDGQTFEDRRCRERVAKLMKDFRAKPPTGTGTEPPSETQTILEFLIEEEDLTINNKVESKEKEEAARVLTTQVQQAALKRLGPRSDPEKTMTQEDLEEQFPEGVPQKLKRRILSVPESPPPAYKRRHTADPTTDYLEKKREHQLEELRLKKELHEQEMKDREAERELKREELQLQREKLAMEKEERKRRYELDREHNARMFDMMIACMQKRGAHDEDLEKEKGNKEKEPRLRKSISP